MIYGHDKTIHQTRHLDVETDTQGQVIAVWFRCLRLPFRQSWVQPPRALAVRAGYEANERHNLLAVEVDGEAAASSDGPISATICPEHVGTEYAAQLPCPVCFGHKVKADTLGMVERTALEIISVSKTEEGKKAVMALLRALGERTE